MAKKKGDTERSPDGLGILMSAFDWLEAMKIAEFNELETERFNFKDIDEVVLQREGFNDGDNWLLIAKLKTGGYGWLSAWCDLSGWDCQSGGRSGIVTTEEEAKKLIEKFDRPWNDNVNERQ